MVWLVLGRPRVCPGDFTGLVPGTNPVRTWDKPGFLLILHTGSPISPGLSLGQTRARRAAQKVYVKKVYVPFSLANTFSLLKITSKKRPRKIAWQGYFYIGRFHFFWGGEGGSPRRREGAGRLLIIENPRRGGGVSRTGGGGGARGREGVCRELGGGEAKYFFSGPKFPPSLARLFLAIRAKAQIFSKTRRCPRNPLGIPTEFIVSAIQNPLNFPEISRVSPN